MKIAIVDDSREYLEILEREILDLNLFSERDAIRKYDNAESFYEEWKQGRQFDLYILDIEMPGYNGIELGKEIHSHNKDSVIIFVTSHTKFALEAYDVHAYHYILKSRMPDKLPRILREVLEKLGEQKKEYYVLRGKEYSEKLLLDDIYYINKVKKQAVFYTRHGELEERKNISDILYELQDKNFTQIDQGVIINVAGVSRVLKDSLVMENGDELKISRSNVKRVKQEIGDYWSEHYC